MTKADVQKTLKKYLTAAAQVIADRKQVGHKKRWWDELPDRLESNEAWLAKSLAAQEAANARLTKPLKSYATVGGRLGHYNNKPQYAHEKAKQAAEARQQVEYAQSTVDRTKAEIVAGEKAYMAQARQLEAESMETLLLCEQNLVNATIGYALKTDKSLLSATCADLDAGSVVTYTNYTDDNAVSADMTVLELAKVLAAVKKKAPVDTTQPRIVKAGQEGDGSWRTMGETVYNALKGLKRNDAIHFAGCVMGVSGLRDLARLYKDEVLRIFPGTEEGEGPQDVYIETGKQRRNPDGTFRYSVRVHVKVGAWTGKNSWHVSETGATAYQGVVDVVLTRANVIKLL